MKFPIQEDQLVRITHGTVQVIDDDIIYVKFDRDTLLEVADFKEATKLVEAYTAQTPMKILVEFLEYTSASREARKYADAVMVDAVAGAIVFDGLAQRILVQAYHLFNSQKHPVKSFIVKNKAIEWLNSKG